MAESSWAGMPVSPSVPEPGRFEIDLDVVAQNVASIRAAIGPRRRFYASLKADAYGYGLEPIARVALSSGADAIAVGSPAEALRARVITPAPVLVYHSFLPEPTVVRELAGAGIAMTVVDQWSAARLAEAGAATVGCYVKVDAGHQRLGVGLDEAVALLRCVARDDRLRLEGVYTHLDTPATLPADHVRGQFERFTRVIDEARRSGVDVGVVMAASSGVLAVDSGTGLDAVEPGRLLYGILSSPDIPVREAIRALRTVLIQVRTIEPPRPGEANPLGLTGPVRMGIVPLGRWHGLHRVCAGAMLVHGRRVPIIGAVSIEHTRLDLTDVPDAQVGDEVVVIGTQGTASISLAEVTSATGLHGPVDISLALAGRVPRHYLGQSRPSTTRASAATSRAGDGPTSMTTDRIVPGVA